MESELVHIELKRPFGDGTVAIDLDPLSLLCRLAASVPPPRSHTVRYAGVLGAASKWRALVVPPLPEAAPRHDQLCLASAVRVPSEKAAYPSLGLSPVG